MREELAASSTATLRLQRENVVFETPSLGYQQVDGGTGCQSTGQRMWVSVRCVVDICGDVCRYSVSLTALPYIIDDGDVITTAIEREDWHYYRVQLGSYDVLDMTLTRLAGYGTTPEYRDLSPPVPPEPPSLPPPPPPPRRPPKPPPMGRRQLVEKAAPSGEARGEEEGVRAGDDVDDDDDDDDDSAAVVSPSPSPSPSPSVRRQLTPGVNEPLLLMAHGLVGTAYARRGQCASAAAHELSMEVGLRDQSSTTGLFCTDATESGDMYISVYAEGLVNNVTLPPRAWYTLSISHEIFDATDLESRVARPGCLAFGQWREYRVLTSGATDGTLDAEIDVPVSAIYARRGLPPTEDDYDAVAQWPLRRLALSGCDVQQPTIWYIAVKLEMQWLADGRSPPLLQQRFELTASMRAANASLMQLVPGTRAAIPHNYLCCGASRDFIVEDLTRSLALRVEITVHSGYLAAIFLKHQSCARYPDDIGPDESCVGRCQMQWLTTYDQYTLDPTYAVDTAVSVPMGIVYADKRAEGNWYISIGGAFDGQVANFSLVAELVESPVLDYFIPLDGEQAAAERCGRFCVVLDELLGADESEEDIFGGMPSAAPPRRARLQALASLVLAVVAAAVAARASDSGRRAFSSERTSPEGSLYSL